MTLVNAETNIMNRILLAASDDGHRLFRNNIGGYRDPKTGRWVRYGVGGTGGSDLLGIARDGRFFAVEVKTATGRIRPEQADFIRMIRSLGGFAGIARSPEDALAIASGLILD